MKRNLKALGLAIAAVLAIGAFVGAAGVQAAAPEFHVTSNGGSGGVVKGASNDNVFTVQGGNVKCVENGGVKGARFETTLPKTGTEATVKAAYGNAGKGCTAFGVAAIVHMGSCDYLLKAVAGSNPPTAKVDIKCDTDGDAIAITASSLPCTITIGPQTGLTHVIFANNEGSEPTDVTASITVEKIKYTVIGLGCSKAGTFEDGKYTGTTTLEAFEGAPKVGFHVF